ncbi:MAG: NUDIX hydrolase [Proteobacteria bacterium]|nr:MAG: NUDIX hydrolase [Pseudomonadota bacterium]PIE68175.1 MAG: NUDIX hydrolase [Deltaproteobacteria bacterium]
MADTHHEHVHDHGQNPRFCSHCGGTLEYRRINDDGPERNVCTACRCIFFEDPKVAACTLPIIDGKIVLLKRGIEPGYGKWVYPGGFMDRGERVEDAAIRETLEECNLKVAIKRLLNVYSYTGHPTVIVVYLVNVVGGTLKAMDETLVAETFSADEIPWNELAFDSTRDALREYLSL